jgi:hypothetical protein
MRRSFFLRYHNTTCRGHMVAPNDPCELAQSHSYLSAADRIVFPKNTTSTTQTDLISITSQADPGSQAFGTGDSRLPRLRRRVQFSQQSRKAQREDLIESLGCPTFRHKREPFSIRFTSYFSTSLEEKKEDDPVL